MDLLYFIFGIIVGIILCYIKKEKTIIEYKEKLSNVIKLKDYYKEKCVEFQQKERKNKNGKTL